MSSERKASTNAVQGVAALVGITLGVLPLVGMVAGRGPGLWSAVIGESGTTSWWVPAAVMIVCVVTLVVAERSAHR